MTDITYQGTKQGYIVEIADCVYSVDFAYYVTDVADTYDVPGVRDVNIAVAECYLVLENGTHVPVNAHNAGVVAVIVDEIYSTDMDDFERRD